MPVIERVQWCVAVPMPVFDLWKHGGAADTVKCELLTYGSYPDYCPQVIQRGKSVDDEFCAMCSDTTEELHRVDRIKTSTYVDASPRENVEHQHYRTRYWLPNCFTALVPIYIDAQQIDFVLMVGVRNNAHAERKVGHSLCPLQSCKEDELCPHAMHMALQVEDGMERDAPNARTGGRQQTEQRRHRQQRVENPLVVTEVVLEAAKLLGVSSTRFAPGGKEKSNDPNMIGYSQSSYKINQ